MYKFRCSKLGDLMTESRSKSEPLSKTTQSYLREVYIENEFGRAKDIHNKYLEKGLFAEEDSLTLVTNNRGILYIKNREKFENDFITGTPDIVLEDKVIDIKTCWDIWTYMDKLEVEKNYYWQLQGYMWLTGKQEAELIYTLVNAPIHMIVNEKQKRMFHDGLIDGTPEFEAMDALVDHEMKYDDIDEKKRMKVFRVERNEDDITRLQNRILEARKYLDTITLN